MNLDDAVEKAVNSIRAILGSANGTEKEVLRAFSDTISSEVEEWETRLEELYDEVDE